MVHYPDASASLATRWNWATRQQACANGCWVVYSIDRQAREGNRIGSHGDERNLRTLEEIIYNRQTVRPERDETPQVAARRALQQRQSREESGAMVTQEVGFLFRYDAGAKNLADLKVSSMDGEVDLKGLPVVWLGKAPVAESIAHLAGMYRREDDAVKEELVTAVALHGHETAVRTFLTEVLERGTHQKSREMAAFWVAEQGGADVVKLLDRTARTDQSQKIREQAVFGLSRMDEDTALDALVALARGGAGDRHTREQAIFWLGQKASKRAADELGGIAENDPDVEVQKKAVFAISQLDRDQGVPRLIQLAKSHRNAAVRRDAIFWLGQTGDPRAVDVLEDIARGK